MNDINSLKDIGLNEISRKTHIDTEYLAYIFDKNFAQLTRFNTKGFVKIIEREYNVDFKEWLDEYNSFINEHKPEENIPKVIVAPKISSYTTTQKSHGFLWSFMLIIIIGFCIWFFEAYKYFDVIPNFFEDKNRSTSYSNAIAVEEASRQLNTLKQEDVKAAISITMDINNSSDTNKSVSTSPIILTTADENSTSGRQDDNVSIIENNTTSTHTQNNEFSTKGLKEIKIKPDKKVWIGIINLENETKRSLNADGITTIPLEKRQLIVTGHGDIELQIGKESIKFRTDTPRRFLSEHDKIKLISLEEFTALNKGKSW